MTTDPSARRRRQHAESLDQLRTLTGRPLPPRRTRVRLAAAYLATAAVLAGLALVPGQSILVSLATLAALLALAALWVALRRATRLVTEAPDEALDELLIRLRDRCFREAYQAYGAVGVLTGVALTIIPDVATLTSGVLEAVGRALLVLGLGIPLVVAAIRLPDVGDEP